MNRTTHLKLLAGAGVASILLGVLLSGSAVEAGISASKHDFTDGFDSTGDGVQDILNTQMNETELCKPCHVPHEAAIAIPLWNHDVALASTYTMYTSPTFSQTGTNSTGPQGISLLCLGCHDGTLGVDAYGEASSVGGPFVIQSSGAVTMALIGNDLSNSHPVSFDYSAAQTDTSNALEYPAIVNATVGLAKLPLYSGSFGTGVQIECGTCHDPHDTTFGKFLRMNNANSALCTNCHTTK